MTDNAPAREKKEARAHLVANLVCAAIIAVTAALVSWWVLTAYPDEPAPSQSTVITPLPIEGANP